ncbi:MAG: phosphatidate cytidylyltransferase [Pontiellaceae bacterium]|nr:phosphatidate cytidylyltransferase [Pontiellaceae bacterium]MBN2783724.1 phosphatidate cytidylyltransferase [Pontiellaceae bacterium]
MSDAIKLRLWGVRSIMDDPVSLWIMAGLVLLIAMASLIIYLLGVRGRLQDATYAELRARVQTWALLLGAILVPLLLGSFWVIIGTGLLSLMCYREFSRATGLFRDISTSIWVVCGIALTTFATLDHWYGLFAALPALGTICIAAFSILVDQPRGYIQRVGLASFSFLLFGTCLGHLGYLANDARFRSLILLVLVSVSLNDVFAYLAGKAFGHKKVFPKTSPNHSCPK